MKVSKFAAVAFRGAIWIAFGVLLILAVYMFLSLVFVHSRRARSTPMDRLYADRNALQQIGRACMAYASDNGGFFPPDFSRLYDKYVDVPALFVAYGDRMQAGDMPSVMEWTSFVYVRGLTLDSPPNAVVAFLPPGHYETDWGVILFAHGLARTVPLMEFTQLMNKTPLRADNHWGYDADRESETSP